ncbi:hypothetical protein cypCar_00016232 [Cyprinus carpio]|nr:hypothetical protein cypCar_00016232 [Cyprinus carpio]
MQTVSDMTGFLVRKTGAMQVLLWEDRPQADSEENQRLPAKLVFGNLYPAYYSYKAVKTKNVKEYVRWMMYWIVFALFTVVETVTDLTIAWFPLYYEIKVAFVIWLLSPYTRGASVIYRKALHPLLSSKERKMLNLALMFLKEIDDYIIQAKERSYESMVNLGKQGLTIAATAAVSAAVKARIHYPLKVWIKMGQGAITEKLRSFSMHDLTQIPHDDAYSSYSSNPARRAIMDQPDGAEYYHGDDDDRSDDEGKAVYSEDEAVSHHGLRRSQSVKITRSRLRRDAARYGSLKIKGKKRPAVNAMTYSNVDN